VLTKLVATDLKGQIGESTPLKIMIATAGFDPDRLKVIKEWQALDKSLHELREAVEKLTQKAVTVRTALSNPATETLQKQQTLAATATLVQEAEQKTDEVLRQLKETLPHATTHRDATDLTLVGAALSRAKHEGLEPLKSGLERATERLAANDPKAAKLSEEPIWTAANMVKAADDAHRQMLAADEAHAATRDLQQIAVEQRALNDQLRAAPNEPSQTERISRRQTVAADEVKQVEEQMKDLAKQTWDWPANTARDHAKDLANSRSNLEKSLAAEPTLDKLKSPSEQLQRSVERAADNLRNATRELAQRAETARKNLQDQVREAADVVAKLTEQLQRKDSPIPKSERWQAAAAELKDRAALEERRPHADPQFAVDASRTADALEALQDAAGTDEHPTNAIAKVKSVEQAFRKLEAGHAVGEQVPALRHLSGKERWEKAQTPADATDRGNDWKLSDRQIKELPQKIERAQLPLTAKTALEKIPNNPPAQQVNTEMNQRQSNPTPGTPVPEPLNKVANEIAQVRKDLQKDLDEARAEINKLAPKLSERLAGLAKTAEKMKNESVAKAQDAAKPENTPKVREEAKNLSNQQQHLDNRVEDVKDALRRDANAEPRPGGRPAARARCGRCDGDVAPADAERERSFAERGEPAAAGEAAERVAERREGAGQAGRCVEATGRALQEPGERPAGADADGVAQHGKRNGPEGDARQRIREGAGVAGVGRQVAAGSVEGTGEGAARQQADAT
jgi:hypothetical protein